MNYTSHTYFHLTTKKIPNEKDADTAILEKELSLKLGVKLTINDKNNKITFSICNCYIIF